MNNWQPSMEMNRRKLFALGVAATVALALPPPAPMLWADGKHDDTDALQDFLNGKRVALAPGAPAHITEDGKLIGGTYRIRGPITVSQSCHVGGRVVAGRDIWEDKNNGHLLEVRLPPRGSSFHFEFLDASELGRLDA